MRRQAKVPAALPLVPLLVPSWPPYSTPDHWVPLRPDQHSSKNAARYVYGKRDKGGPSHARPIASKRKITSVIAIQRHKHVRTKNTKGGHLQPYFHFVLQRCVAPPLL